MMYRKSQTRSVIRVMGSVKVKMTLIRICKVVTLRVIARVNGHGVSIRQVFRTRTQRSVSMHLTIKVGVLHSRVSR